MMPDPITLEELAKALDAQRGGKGRATEDELAERAVAALGTLRGLTYADKQKVIRRMGRMLRPR